MGDQPSSDVAYAEDTTTTRDDFKLRVPSPCVIRWILCVFPLVLLNTAAASIADFTAGHYPAHIGPIPMSKGVATLIIFQYTVAHVTFVCSLVLIFAAGKGAEQHVLEASETAFTVSEESPDVDWASVRPQYVRLVKLLRSHCNIVRRASTLTLVTLSVSY